MKTVEERVVEMRFDNDQFEKETKKTLSTLQKLKMALDFSGSSKTLEAFERNANRIRFDGMADGIRSLERRFSTFGIVGMRVIENLTDGMMNQFGKAVSFVENAIVSGGIRRSMNIENAHFQLQALLKDEDKVQAVMDNAMESVDGTAYAYDEAAKAASMFAASGLEAGEEMERALKGITGVAAMTNSEYEGIAEIFTTVAGNGRIMGDQLLQLSSRGLNAAATIADFFNKVNDGTAQVSDGIRDSVAALSEGVLVSEKDIRSWVSEGEISFNMFAEAMNYAFGDSAKRANETFTGSLSNMKSALARIGAEFTSPLIVQNGALVELFNTLRERINDIKKEITFDEERGNVDALSKQFTDAVIRMAKAATTFAKDADINGPIRILYSNVEIVKNLLGGLATVFPPIGEAFRRTFTDFKIDSLVDFSAYLEKITERFKLTEQGGILVRRIFSRLFKVVKMLIAGFKELSPEMLKIGYTTKTLRLFYRLLKSFLNVGGNVVDIFLAFGRSVSTVFSGFNSNPFESFLILLLRLSQGLVDFTSKIRLSEEGVKNLEDGFTGILSIVKLVLDAFLGLLGGVTSVEEPITSVSGALLSMFGYFGRGLTAFSEWVRSSETVSKSCNLITTGIRLIIEAIGFLITKVGDGVTAFTKFETVPKIFTSIRNGIENTVNNGSPLLELLLNKTKKLRSGFIEISDKDVTDGLKYIFDMIGRLIERFKSIDLSDPSKVITKLKDSVEGLLALARSNPGIDTFATNISSFVSNVGKGLSSENLGDKVNGVQGVLSGFAGWVKETFLPMVENLGIGDVLAGGMSFSGIFAFLKAIKAFSAIGTAAGKFGGVLESVSKVLESYQKSIQANILLKIAAAIAILSSSLVLLSFTDTDKMLDGAKALALVGGVLVAAMVVMSKLKKTGKDAKDGAQNVNAATKVLSTAVDNFFKAKNKNNISGIITSIGITIGAIAASVAGLAKVYKKNKDGFKAATSTIVTITGIFGGLIATTLILSKILKTDTSSFTAVAKGLKMMAVSILIVVTALKKIFKIELPDDWKTKLVIFGGIFAALATVALAMMVLSRISKGGEGIGKSVLFLALSLIPTISALKKLFKMDLPTGWEKKLILLGLILAGLSATMIAMALAARLSNGAIKAGGTITSMATFISAITASLMVLSLIDGSKLMGGATALGLVLVALAVSLSQAGKITDKGSGETVRAMSSVIGTITASLGILAAVSWEKLLKASISLNSVLLSLAVMFSQVAKVTNEKAFVNIFAMVSMIITVSYLLYKLAEQPWDGMLSAGVSLSAVLLSLSYAFKQMEESKNVDVQTIGKFLLATTAVIPLGLALYELSQQPWDGMLAAGGSLSLTILAFSKAFSIIGSTENVDLKSVGSFLLLTLSVVPIGLALYELSQQPWDGMLAAAASMSLTLLALSAVAEILSTIGKGGGSSIKAALIGIAILDLLIVDLGLVLAAMGALIQNEKIKALLNGGVEVFGLFGLAIGTFIGNIVGAGIGSAASSLKSVGQSLSDFMEKAKPFFDNVGTLEPGVMEAVKMLAESILILIGGDFISKLSGKDSLVKFGKGLPDFGKNIKKFANKVKGIEASSVEGASAAAKLLSEMAKNLPYSNESLMGKIFGAKSLAEFADELDAFAEPIVNFSDKVKDVKASSVKGAAAAAKMMSEVSKSLDYNSETLFGKLFGAKSLAEFADELDAFAEPIVNFSDKVKDVKASSVKGAAAAGEIMAKMATNLPYSDETLAAKFFGTKNLSDFGEELGDFGEGIVKFAEKVDGIEEDSVKSASAIADIMSVMANMVPSEGGFFSLFTGKKSLASFGDNLASFGDKVDSFCSTIASISDSSVTTTNSTISSLVETLKSAGDEGVQEFISAFNNSEGSLSKAMTGMINFAVDSLKNKNSSFENSGKVSLAAYTDGIAKSSPNIKSTTETVVNHAVNAANAIKEEMISAGEQAAIGFAQGVTNKKGEAALAGRSLGLAAYNAAREALDEHSPSRLMGEVGAFAALGLINEMMSYISKSYKAGTELGNAALEGATEGSKKLVTFIDENWNTDPVIHPRVDLSDLTKSGSEINRMFNDSIYTIRTNASMTGGYVGEYQNRATNNDLLDAIKSLIPALEDLGGDTYNIDGISYSESSDVSDAIRTLVRATKVKRRV